jgi:hypothetical protein
MQSIRPRHRPHAVAAPAAALLFACLLAAAGCAVNGPGQGPTADPANPLELNEAAVASAARGDIKTAWLLLERAARLAPHDTRIAANLAALREFRNASPRGRIVSSAAAAPTPNPVRAATGGSVAAPAIPGAK